MTFGILQRCQALFSAHLQMQRKTFDAGTQFLCTITMERLAKAQEEEAKGEVITDPVVQLLK